MINPEAFFNSLSTSEKEGCRESMGAYRDCADQPSIIILQIYEDLLIAKDFGSLEVIGISDMDNWEELEEVLPEGETKLHKLDFQGIYSYIVLLYCNGKYVTSSHYDQDPIGDGTMKQCEEKYSTLENESADESNWNNNKRSYLSKASSEVDLSNPLILEDPVLLIRLAKTFSSSMTGSELYEATRGNWVLNKERAQLAAFAYALHKGEVLQVYKIESWSETEDMSRRGTPRLRFTGRIATERQHHNGCSLAHYFKRGEANPTKFLNCNHNIICDSVQSACINEADRQEIKDEASKMIPEAKQNDTCQNISSDHAQYLEEAEQGDVAAQYNLGWAYINGEGVEQDSTEAFNWFLKASKQGNADGQWNIGLMYELGEGVEQDVSKAFEWYHKAAEQGSEVGLEKLGEMYRWGRGVEQDDASALKWYLKAASLGSGSAQYSLGCIYEDGSGVQEDDATAFSWYLKAAEQGLSEAQYAVGCKYRGGNGVEKDTTQALEWYLKAAEQDHSMAMFTVGWMHENAEGCERNSKAALYWYTKAAESGSAHAQLMLGFIYENGLGIDRDPEQAHKWFSEEAEQPEAYAWSIIMRYAEEGNAKAQFILGCLYTQGRPGLETDSSLAHQWLQKSADQKYECAQAKLNSLDLPEKSATQSHANMAGGRRGSTESNTKRSFSCRWIRRVLRGLLRRLLK